MKHLDLRNDIEGSILKKHFLEAFLLQSAYIEALLKQLVDFSLWAATSGISESETAPKEHKKLLLAIRQNANRYTFNQLTMLLRDAGILDADQSKLLDEYRKKRNPVLHNLVREVTTKETIDIELREICQKGKTLLESQQFQSVVDLIDWLEKKHEAPSPEAQPQPQTKPTEIKQ